MDPHALAAFEQTLAGIKSEGLLKVERPFSGAQGPWIQLENGPRLLNLCGNNYLGLCGHPEILTAAKRALDEWGFGLSSVRFICGTQGGHRQLEQALSTFLDTEETILYSSCFDANGGLFETLLGENDAVISDSLNHASIIDGIRLCKAKRYRYQTGNLEDLEIMLKEAEGSRLRLIVTDGVFSMDGHIAPLKGICDLADKYRALVMVDDSHGVGFMGENGRGTPEHCGVLGRIDILTGTFGKALGGASGGYTSGRKVIIDLLRQRSRPYLFSNSLPPVVVGATLRALELVAEEPHRREKLHRHTRRFREALGQAGFPLKAGEHPIVPIMVGEAGAAAEMSAKLQEAGVLAVGFFFPVVPKGQARIRVQLSAALSEEDLNFGMDGFIKVGKSMGII